MVASVAAAKRWGLDASDTSAELATERLIKQVSKSVPLSPGQVKQVVAAIPRKR